jgi:hypothetical protein
MCVSCLTPSNSTASARFVCRSNNPTNLHFSRYYYCPLITQKPQPHCNKQNDSSNEIYALLRHYTAYSSNPVTTFRNTLSAQPSRINKSNQNAGNNMAEKSKYYLHRGGSLKSRTETILLAFLCSEFHINFKHL